MVIFVLLCFELIVYVFDLFVIFDVEEFGVYIIVKE